MEVLNNYQRKKLDENNDQEFYSEPKFVYHLDANFRNYLSSVYDEVENGAVVPIKVETSLKNVKTITIFADKNPNPLIANFNLTPSCSGFISTRIKVSEPSNIIVIVNDNDKLHMTKKFIIVHENGCG